MYKMVADNICTVIIERKHTLSLVRLHAGLPPKKGLPMQPPLIYPKSKTV